MNIAQSPKSLDEAAVRGADPDAGPRQSPRLRARGCCAGCPWLAAPTERRLVRAEAAPAAAETAPAAEAAATRVAAAGEAAAAEAAPGRTALGDVHSQRPSGKLAA